MFRVDFLRADPVDIDLDELQRLAVPVKGVRYARPERFLEIFGDGSISALGLDRQDIYWPEIRSRYMPRIPGVSIELGDDVPQPPFAWRDSDPLNLSVSFTYNTNAIYRILLDLTQRGAIDRLQIDGLLDRACAVLARLYKAREGFLLRNINNNFNMYLISKVIEVLLGKRVYDSERQEVDSTEHSLDVALDLARSHRSAPVEEKMGLALGRGVSFIESRMEGYRIARRGIADVEQQDYRYHGRRLAIDDRARLIALIEDTAAARGHFTLAVILDDATETVEDLAWMLDLMSMFPCLRIHLLLNVNQISINFSSEMLGRCLCSQPLGGLRSFLGQQLFATTIYCPFISFQTNYLPPDARKVIADSDAVFVKGANFFETCQIREKPVFHAFVVYGPVSRSYTGLRDLDGVFAYVPPGEVGFSHRPRTDQHETLQDVVMRREKA